MSEFKPAPVTRAQSQSNLIESMKMASLEELELRSGSKVKIVGLKKFPKFNGQEGQISEGKDVFWTVTIPSLQNSVVRVRSVNLELIDNDENHDEHKYTAKGLKAKEFLTWLTKELAENEPDDPAEFAFGLLKDSLAMNPKSSLLSDRLKELEKKLDACVSEHKFLEAHEIKEEIKDLNSKTKDIKHYEEKLYAAMREHNFLLAHDLKEQMAKMINTPSKFNYKHWLNTLKPADKAEFVKFTKGTPRTLEWITGLSVPDLRGAIRDVEVVRRIWASIRNLRAAYN